MDVASLVFMNPLNEPLRFNNRDVKCCGDGAPSDSFFEFAGQAEAVSDLVDGLTYCSLRRSSSSLTLEEKQSRIDFDCCPHFFCQRPNDTSRDFILKVDNMMTRIEAMPTTAAASKRLLEPDVNAIFSCLATNEVPPEHLNFKIIRIPHNALKLCPPSFEFEDGLYLLLRSDNSEPAPVPPALADSVMTDSDLVSLPHCPWSLSGPQGVKRPGQEIQRYCYPRGNSSYSIGKGGALWTRVDMNGHEDTNCRLLHVYYSKRAGTDNSFKSKGVVPRQPKRKVKPVGNGHRKRTKLAETGKEMKSSTFLGGMVPSPCLSHLSIDLGGHFDFDSDNFLGITGTPIINQMLGDNGSPINQMYAAKGSPPINQMFGTKGTPNNQAPGANDAPAGNFSFVPVQEMHNTYGVEKMILNDPAFNSAFAKSPGNLQQRYVASSGRYYGPHFHARHPPRPPHRGGHAFFARDWVRAPPAIPQLPSSSEKVCIDGEGRQQLQIADFSKKLWDVENSLSTDIRNSSSADQVIKLQLLQSWAKGLSSRPLLSQTESITAGVTVAESNANTQVAIKMEYPEPALEVEEGSNVAQSIANTLVAIKMESPDA